MHHRLIFIMASGVAVALLGHVSLKWYNYRVYKLQMQPVYEVIDAGEQCWADESTKLLQGIIKSSPDAHLLAERLSGESDGSLVAEGMLLAVRTGDPEAREMLKDHLSDTRGNWAMTRNGDLAKKLLGYLDKKSDDQWITFWLHTTDAG